MTMKQVRKELRLLRKDGAIRATRSLRAHIRFCARPDYFSGETVRTFSGKAAQIAKGPR